MSAEYTKDPNGVVHVMSPAGEGDFTFCHREVGVLSLEDGFGEDDEFGGESHSGPGTCPECRENADAIREALRGVRWRVPS